jgi:hypothetical protein
VSGSGADAEEDADDSASTYAAASESIAFSALWSRCVVRTARGLHRAAALDGVELDVMLYTHGNCGVLCSVRRCGEIQYIDVGRVAILSSARFTARLRVRPTRVITPTWGI